MVVAASEHEVAVVVAANEHGQVSIEVTYKEPIARPEHAMRLRSPGVGLVVFGVGLVVFAVGLIGAEYLACAGHARTRVAHAAPTTTFPWTATQLALAPSAVLHLIFRMALPRCESRFF